jgi:amino acid adenylation domain-containing protein
MLSVINNIKISIESHHNRIAVVHNDNIFTYQDLESHSNKLAHYLDKFNVKKNSKVAFLMRRSFDMLTTILAIWKLGATYIPLDPKTPKKRIEHMLNDISPTCIVSDPALLSKIPYNNGLILTLADPEYVSSKETNCSVNGDFDNLLAYIIYTSGSTGQPKGVMLTHANVVNHIKWLIQDFQFSSEDCFSFNSSMAFDFSVACTILPLAVGAKIVITNEEDTLDIEKYCQQLVKNKVTFVKWTPSYFKLLVDYVEIHHPDLSAFRYLMTGGEELLTSYVERWLKIYPEHRIINEYGPTEASVGITTHVITKDTLDKSLYTVPIGKPAINTTLYLVDQQNNLVADGETGELLIGGASVARGYYNQPQLTAERFIDDHFTKNSQKLYRTGDLVKKLPDNSYLYVSRIDNQVKVDGYRIELNEIEHWLLKYAGIKHVKVIIDKTNRGTPIIIAYFVIDGLSPVSFDDLRNYLSNCLPQFMIPSHFVQVSHIPCNRNGKVDIEALKKQIIQPQAKQNEIIVEATDYTTSLVKVIKKYINLDEININIPFSVLGVTSLLAAQIVNDINQQKSNFLKVQDLFTYPTISTLANYIKNQKSNTTVCYKMDNANLQSISQQEPIAIIAMDCRLPGADSCEELWKLCQEGKETISVFEPGSQEKKYVYARGVLNNIEYFDADFFNFTPKEAHLSDPQHRLLIESAWNALEKAGYIPNPDDNYKIGIYVSMNDSTYLLDHNLIENLESNFSDRFAMLRLMSPQCLATKIAYLLNCTGPSITVQTACSSSLVAIVLACQQLSSYQCNLALAGGISVVTPQDKPYLYQQGNIFSPDGHCRPFDAKAAGTVFSNGLGTIVLKRLSDALRDNDSIICVIKGASTNNDGYNKMSYAAPSVQGQMDCILSAQRAANIDANTIQYIETHGTGTLIGDPIEIEALTKAFQFQSRRHQVCALGSLKANIGHTHVAAGVAGLIKTALALQQRQIPPSIHFDEPNPYIDWEHTPFYVNKRLQYWYRDKAPRRAAVSAFGVGGTNAHIILEEAPKSLSSPSYKKSHLLLLSAKTPAALQVMHNNLINYFKEVGSTKNQYSLLADAAFTLQLGRKKFRYCAGILCEDLSSAINQLQLSREKNTPLICDKVNRPKLIFLFPGQGTQYLNLTLSLYTREKTYREQLDHCLKVASSYIGCDLKDILFSSNNQFVGKINQTEFTHPLLFAVEFSLAKLLIEWDIKPDAMLGHSLGEYVAACLAGVFSLEDAIKLVCARGKAIAKTEQGAMLATPLLEKDALHYCNDEISLAAINADDLCVFSGTSTAITALYEKLRTLLPVSSLRWLNCSHAFHSRLLQPVAATFLEVLQTVHKESPVIPYLSNLTGNWIEESDVKDNDYWINHMLKPVQFSQCAKRITRQSDSIFLEIGPGKTLLSLLQRNAKELINSIELVPNEKQSKVENHQIENALRTLWYHNYPINWHSYYQHEKRSRIALPTYPFQRKRYWFDEIISTENNQPIDLHPSHLEAAFYVPTWLRESERMNKEVTSLQHSLKYWIIFDDNSALSRHTIDYLKLNEKSVFVIRKGSDYTHLSPGHYTINPRDKSHYNQFVHDIINEKAEHYAILHFWSTISYNDLKQDDLLESPILYDGLYSGIFLIQALHTLKPKSTLSCVIITAQLQRVLGNEYIEPLKSSVLSLCRVIPLENKEYRFVAIDIDDNENPNNIPVYTTHLVQKAIDVFEQKNAESLLTLAFRHQYCWKLVYQPANLNPETRGSELKINPMGVYFITGGLGAMGLTIADWLSQKKPVTMLLLSRSSFPLQNGWEKWLEEKGEDDPLSQKIIKLKQIINRNCRVLTASGDVANHQQMQSLIETTEKTYGKIKGIFHLAGIPGEGLTVLKDKTKMFAVLLPKIQGTKVLAHLFKETHLDFVVIASSLTAIAGGVGQIDYCAANLFLDYFIQQYPFMRCQRVLALNWNSWTSVGMASSLTHSKKHKELYTKNSVTPEQAMFLLEKAFKSKYEQIAISQISPEAERKRIIAAFEYAHNNQKNESISESNQVNQLNIRETVMQIWQDILGVKVIQTKDTFYSLGGDSLSAIQLLVALENQLGVDINLQELAHAHTLDSLAKLIETRPVRSPSMIVPCSSTTAYNNCNKSIYFIHPIGGTVLCYFPLIPYLDSNFYYYALQDPELTKGRVLFSTIQEMAEYYAKAICAQHAKGEIILIGASFGGNMAIEMVAPLKRLGINVQKVILIDSWANLGSAFSLQEEAPILSESLNIIKNYYGVKSQQYQTVQKRLLWLRSYTPSQVDIPLVLLTARELLPLYKKIACDKNGWASYCSIPILKYMIEGNHDNILQQNNLPELGRLINTLL